MAWPGGLTFHAGSALPHKQEIASDLATEVMDFLQVSEFSDQNRLSGHKGGDPTQVREGVQGPRAPAQDRDCYVSVSSA
jgi:hypothetical protein